MIQRYMPRFLCIFLDLILILLHFRLILIEKNQLFIIENYHYSKYNYLPSSICTLFGKFSTSFSYVGFELLFLLSAKSLFSSLASFSFSLSSSSFSKFFSILKY
jgi:hypothetical protein